MEEEDEMRVPKVEPRRPYYENVPEGYLESDLDFMRNNRFACVWFLEHRDEIAKALRGKK
jgi:hypothetical protein